LVRPGRLAGDTPVSSGRGYAATRPLAVLDVTPQAVRVRPVAERQLGLLWKSALAGWLGFWLFARLIRMFTRRDR
jgi:hypothetical protein